jgi:LmbE family N-acetylglucosaminyl deacetylase
VNLFDRHDRRTRVLVLAPHTDDAELGSGASIARLVREGAEVQIVAFSAAEQSVPGHLPPDVNREDAVTSAAHLSIPEDQVRALEFPVRNFPEHRQGVLDALIELRSEIDPDVVIGPCSTDRHQDHEVIHVEMMRAFARKTVLGYELPWNCTSFEASAHVEVTEDDLMAKLKALASYRSQEARSYLSEEYLRSWAVMRGTQTGLALAEAYEVLHWRMDL